jgi:hypothetical protein
MSWEQRSVGEFASGAPDRPRHYFSFERR